VRLTPGGDGFESLALVPRKLLVRVADPTHVHVGGLDHGDVPSLVVDDRIALTRLRQRLAVAFVVHEEPGRRSLVAAQHSSDELFAKRCAPEPELGLPHPAVPF
jgi:hypothetical protein